MKRAICLLMMLSLFLACGLTAYAEDYTGGDWYVHFTPETVMDSNFTEATATQMSEAMYALQPGDSATFYMELQNQYEESTDWYMTNEVLRSLEASQDVAEGGAYTYELTYYGPDGTPDVLYSSEAVGGEDEENVDDRVGLREATSSLEDWLYLDTLSRGETGNVTLRVGLEGETQGNKYQDTMAQVQMNFAVELTRPETTTRVYKPVRTGDENPILLWSAVMMVCGVAALGLGVYSIKRRKRNEEDGDE